MVYFVKNIKYLIESERLREKNRGAVSISHRNCNESYQKYSLSQHSISFSFGFILPKYIVNNLTIVDRQMTQGAPTNGKTNVLPEIYYTLKVVELHFLKNLLAVNRQNELISPSINTNRAHLLSATIKIPQ